MSEYQQDPIHKVRMFGRYILSSNTGYDCLCRESCTFQVPAQGFQREPRYLLSWQTVEDLPLANQLAQNHLGSIVLHVF